MNFRIIFAVIVFAVDSIACQNLSPGGRTSLHGMVIFGNGSYFIEHIPMLHPPHDFQAIASVTIKNQSGKILKPDLSAHGFTLKPVANFSLNDFLNGTMTKFSGEIYQGSFEQGGSAINGFESVQIEVQKVELARQLPSASLSDSFLVTDVVGNMYKTKIITPTDSVQLIENVTLGKKLWCAVGPDFYDFCKSDF